MNNTNTYNNDAIEKMIASGALSTMTECAYGSTIADSEHKHILKGNKKKDNKKLINR